MEEEVLLLEDQNSKFIKVRPVPCGRIQKRAWHIHQLWLQTEKEGARKFWRILVAFTSSVRLPVWSSEDSQMSLGPFPVCSFTPLVSPGTRALNTRQAPGRHQESTRRAPGYPDTAHWSSRAQLPTFSHITVTPNSGCSFARLF